MLDLLTGAVAVLIVLLLAWAAFSYWFDRYMDVKKHGVGAPRERLTSGACTVCPDGWDATPTANFVRCRAPEGTPPLACGRDVTFKDGPTGLRNWAKAFGVPWAEPCDLSHPEQYLRKN